MLFCVVIVTLLSAFRVRKILPVAALEEVFKLTVLEKITFLWKKRKAGFIFCLLLNPLVANAKQNIMILVIIIALTFASIFSVVLYYNVASDKTAFVNLFGAEPANVYSRCATRNGYKSLLSDIERLDHVRKVNLFD